MHEAGSSPQPRAPTPQRRCDGERARRLPMLASSGIRTRRPPCWCRASPSRSARSRTPMPMPGIRCRRRGNCTPSRRLAVHTQPIVHRHAPPRIPLAEAVQLDAPRHPSASAVHDARDLASSCARRVVGRALHLALMVELRRARGPLVALLQVVVTTPRAPCGRKAAERSRSSGNRCVGSHPES